VIRKMCNKAILLHQGKLIGSDSVDEILSSYNNLVRS
jgi:ABC-type polysaccharide/polyol phosphate transport system ATPase subunit